MELNSKNSEGRVSDMGCPALGEEERRMQTSLQQAGLPGGPCCMAMPSDEVKEELQRVLHGDERDPHAQPPRQLQAQVERVQGRVVDLLPPTVHLELHLVLTVHLVERDLWQ